MNVRQACHRYITVQQSAAACLYQHIFSGKIINGTSYFTIQDNSLFP